MRFDVQDLDGVRLVTMRDGDREIHSVALDETDPHELRRQCVADYWETCELAAMVAIRAGAGR